MIVSSWTVKGEEVIRLQELSSLRQRIRVEWSLLDLFLVFHLLPQSISFGLKFYQRLFSGRHN